MFDEENLISLAIFLSFCLSVHNTYVQPWLWSESQKFVVRFWLHWRQPEGIQFHWRDLKNRFLQFKTLRRVIYIHGGIQISFLGIHNSTGGIQISFLGVYNSTGGIQISFQGRVYNSTGGIQIYFLGVYTSSGGIQISILGVYNSTWGIQISFLGV